MTANGLINKIRRFDAYPKTLDDFRIKTCAGAAVTILSTIFMLILFWLEVNFYLTNEVEPELLVDISRGSKLDVNINITFFQIHCPYLTFDAMDIAGEQQLNIVHNMFKQRTFSNGSIHEDGPTVLEKAVIDTKPKNECGSCYGAESSHYKCCKTCDDVKQAYKIKGWAFVASNNILQCLSEFIHENENEGCMLHGTIEINKVAGNFHFASGNGFGLSSHIHTHDIQLPSGKKVNLTHQINHLSFGKDYPGQINPLDGTKLVASEGFTMFQYFLKIVPTVYNHLDKGTIFANQFSATKSIKVSNVEDNFGFGERALPGVFFTYELSPMMIKYTERKRSFMHFLTGVCSIIGGVFTVAGLVDAFIYNLTSSIKKNLIERKLT